MSAGDHHESLFGINEPTRLTALSDSYALAINTLQTVGSQMATDDIGASLFGSNVLIRLVALGDGSHAVAMSTQAVGSTRAPNDKAMSILGTNIPIRLVSLGDGTHAIATAAAVVPRPAGDVVISLWGINEPSRLVALGDGTFALATTDYGSLVKGVFGSNLVLYLPMTETSGTTALDNSTTGANGTYGAGVTLANDPGAGPTMGRAPFFHGAATNLITFPAASLTALNSAWNPDEFTASCWLKMDKATDWASASQFLVFVIGADNNNKYLVFKLSANTMQYLSARGGSSTSRNRSTSELVWIHAGLTASKSANIYRAYYNGIQVGVDQALAGTWAGALASSFTQIGAQNGALNWFGNLQHLAIGKAALSAASMAQLAVAA